MFRAFRDELVILYPVSVVQQRLFLLITHLKPPNEKKMYKESFKRATKQFSLGYTVNALTLILCYFRHIEFGKLDDNSVDSCAILWIETDTIIYKALVDHRES